MKGDKSNMKFISWSEFFSSSIFPKIAVAGAVATSVATSGYAGLKLVDDYNKSDVFRVQAEDVTEKVASVGQETKNEDTNLGVTANNLSGVGSAVKPSTKPGVSPAPTPWPTAGAKSLLTATGSSGAVTTGGGCLITLSGQQFDVTSLRKSHPGGDIFVCNTDMTASYQNQHGSSLARMQKYAVGSGVSGSSGSSGSGATGSSSTAGGGADEREAENEDREEREDEESKKEQERYLENQKKQEEAAREQAKEENESEDE